MKYIRKLIASFMMALLLLTSMPAHAATAATLLLSPSSSVISKGDTLKLVIKIRANDTPVDTVDIHLAFPDEKLTFSGLDKTDSKFSAVIPASPSAKDGMVQFAASTVGGAAVTDTAPVMTLLFKANASSGTAQFSLTDSSAAHAGAVIAVDSAAVNVALSGTSADQTSAYKISNIAVTKRTISGATISWHTSVATTGTVDFGTTNKYGAYVTDDTVGMDHSITVNGLFAGHTSLHYQITAVDQNALVQHSTDQAFRTMGYTVAIRVVDGNNQTTKSVSGAKVVLASAKPVLTDALGVAAFTDVAPGSNEVTVNGGKKQVVLVKDTRGDQATKSQIFTVKNDKTVMSSGLVVLIGVLLAIVAATAGWQLARRKR